MGERKVFSTKCRRLKLDPFLTQDPNVNSKRIINLNVRTTIIKLMRFHFTPNRMAVMKKTGGSRCWQDVETLEPSYTAGGAVR